jgi:hypothetical protein
MTMKTLALILSGMLVLSSFPAEARGFYHPRVSIGFGFYPYGWYDPWFYGYAYGYPYWYDPYPYRVPPAKQDEGAAERLFAYPAGGQSGAQTAQDRKECNDWAVTQSGLDPATAKKRAKAEHLDDYNRAFVACLEGRNYTVR